MRDITAHKLAEQIINLLREYGELSSAEIAKLLGVNRRSVAAILARLRREGLLSILATVSGAIVAIRGGS